MVFDRIKWPIHLEIIDVLEFIPSHVVVVFDHGVDVSSKNQALAPAMEAIKRKGLIFSWLALLLDLVVTGKKVVLPLKIDKEFGCNGVGILSVTDLYWPIFLKKRKRTLRILLVDKFLIVGTNMDNSSVITRLENLASNLAGSIQQNFYKMLMGNKVKCCCCSRHYEGWWHGLNIVKVTYLERTYPNVEDIETMLNALPESDAEDKT
ncbi:hypothetical protein PIB30_081143 [Stylosanthes scabra]|uniref:Uncharacterized protein n=1 Tax=Stylosanthes scabra TaxID=79078 RepID=A0ABU6SRS7_9FABA|nr:hypothetical protein [Stylosanthes scabra]